MFKRYIILLVVITLAWLAGCSSEKQLSQGTVSNTSQTPNSNSNPEAQPQQEWVTVSLEMTLYGPDGSEIRKVRVTNKPTKLAKGEWVDFRGKRYTGRAGGRSVVWLESGEMKSQNVDIRSLER